MDAESIEYDRFIAWERKVDDEVARRVGVGLHSLPDVPTRDWFDDGKSVVAAARLAIRMAKEG